MYGIVLITTLDYLRNKYGPSFITQLSKNIDLNIVSDEIYSDTLLDLISKQVQDPEFYENIGSHTVKYLLKTTHEPMFLTLWTGYKEFIYGLEKFNEYFKIHFPTKKTPVFTSKEVKDGIQIECMSDSEEIVQFSIGIISEVGRSIYRKAINLTILEKICDQRGTNVVLKVFFEDPFRSPDFVPLDKYAFPLDPKLLGHIFPYSILVRMRVISLGSTLLRTFPDANGRHFSEVVILKRPDIPISQKNVMKYSGKIFDLLIKCIPVSKMQGEGLLLRKKTLSSWETIDGIHYLRLKGKIMFIKEWKMFLFIGTPVLMSLTSLYSSGISICHLSIHDFSRDLMLAEAQQTVELKMAFDQGQEKQRKLEDFLKKLNEEMSRTNAILNEMVPENSIMGFERNRPLGMKLIQNVTVLISDIVNFTTACSFMTPMEVVTTLNAMYSQFDFLTAKHGAYKVETIGDAYMIVSTISEKGSPQNVCDVALDMIETIKKIKDPKAGTHLNIRIGIHTGPVVAGIVGLKVPKFCLFGSTVKTVALLEASSSPMKIKISQTTKDALNQQYNCTQSECVITNKAEKMATFWLNYKETNHYEQ